MPTPLEYAQFATNVYAASDNNALIAPLGWTRTHWRPDTYSGFSAGTFVNQDGSEVVIAYTGSNDLTDPLSWPAAMGEVTPQIVEAMRYYFSVRRDYPSATISFTGHSLGGGLASLMAVYFDKPATVFDAAPLREAALSGVVRAYARLSTINEPSGTVERAFLEYLMFPVEAVAKRGSNVTNYAVEGEILSHARTPWSTLGGPDEKYLMGESTATPFERHSVALLTAFAAVSDFNEVAKRVPFLVTEIMDKSLFAAPTISSAKDDILLKLLRHQLGVKGRISADRMLQRFTDDVNMATQPGGLTMKNEDLGKALVAFAMQMYDRSGTAADKTLFKEVSGGIRFDRNDIAASLGEIKGYNKYFVAFLDTLGVDERDLITKELPRLRDWFIQAGGSALQATAGGRGTFMLGGEDDDQLSGGSEKDVLAGGKGDDTLDGMAGDDVLLGGDGDDTLKGGEGSDTLLGGDGDDKFESGAGDDEIKGGDGFDTYRYRRGDGYDTITDSDGDGEILSDGRRLHGGKRKKDETIYKSRDGKHSYEWEGGDLTIDSTIVVADFNNGDLGIYLDEEDDPDLPDFTPPPPRDPLALDLDGSGKIDIIARSDSSAYFDFNNDGIAERSGWIAAQDGFLVLDANGNGAIDNLSELFGTAEVSGFADLKRRIDGNGDNLIDANDEKFGQLRVWQDANGDGIAQSAELAALGDVGITSIGLDSTSVSIQDGGNRITATGMFVRNGETMLAADVALSVDFRLTDSNPVRALDQDLALDAAVYRLPWLRGFGLVRTLPHAYQIDPELREAAAVLARGSAPEILTGFDAFFVKWSGLEAAHARAGVTRSELTVEDKVWMLDTLIGRTDNKSVIEAAGFSWLGTWNEAATNRKYAELVGRAALGFAMQAAGEELLDGAYYSLESDKFIAPDPSRLQKNLQDRLKAITGEDDAMFASMVLARLAADEVRLDTSALKQALSESPFAQLYQVALDFSGQHVALASGNVGFGVPDASGWFLIGTDNGEAIYAGRGNDVVFGAGGRDWLYGAAGADTLGGGRGDDDLDGGAGNDLYLVERGGGADRISDHGGTDTIRFGAGIAAKDVRVTRSGMDLWLSVGDTDDQVIVRDWFSGDPDKVEWIEFADGTVWGVPQLVAAALDPTEGADSLNGGSGDDTLAGLAGNDSIKGEAGNDTLDGGAGDDDLRGGTGNDGYLFARGDGADTVYDEDASAGNIDTVRFAAGIAVSDIVVTRDEYNLFLNVAGSADRIELRYWFSREDCKVERVEFADGTVWGVPELLAASRVPTDGPGHLVGGSGNDNLIGLGGDDTLDGDDGNDILNGGAGTDHLRGGTGDDIYLFERGDGVDTIDDESGSADTIRFGAGIAAGDVRVTRDISHLYLSLDDSEDRLELRYWFDDYASYQIERIEFADGTVWGVPELQAAALRPSAGDDFLVGGSGNDVLTGADGADTLTGDAGDDTLQGGADDDRLYGGSGDDIYLFERGDGSDTVWDYASGYGAGGNDTIRFGAGIAASDVVVRRSGRDLLLILAGSDDRLTVKSWDNDGDRIERVEFADGTAWSVQDLLAASILPTEAADKLHGTGGDDVITGLGGDDTLSGGAGNDTLAGGVGADTLYGGDGNDIYRFERGDGADEVKDYGGSDDVLVFGPGISAADVHVSRDKSNLYLSLAGTDDRLVLQNWFRDEYRVERVVFADGSAWDAQDLLAATGIATEGDDYLGGTDGNDSLLGSGGNDTLDGDGGDDTLEGGAGDDVLLGGAGNDVYLIDRGDGADSVYDIDMTEGNIDTVRFASGITAADIRVTRDRDNLYLKLTGSEDRLNLQDWFRDRAYRIERVEFADGTSWSEQNLLAAVSTPTAGDDYLEGTSGNDILAGGAGNDTLLDTNGSNVIDGGGGNDVVYSEHPWNDSAVTPANFICLGTGDDTLALASGGVRDVVVFNAGDGQDSFTQMGSGFTLSLGGGISVDSLGLHFDGADLVMDMGKGDAIRFSAEALAQAENVKVVLQIVGPTVDTYDFGAVIKAFKASVAQGTEAATPVVPLAPELALHRLASSEDQVIGGNLAYRYARDGNLSGLPPEAMREAVASPQFGLVAQQVSIDNNSVAGTDADDTLIGSAGRDTLSGKGGRDTLDGGLGNDTYLFGRGDEQDRIVDAGGSDTIAFGPGIVPESLFLSLEGGTLVIHVGRGGDVIRLEGFDPEHVLLKPSIEHFRFSNGLVLGYEQLLARGFEISGNGALSGTDVRDIIVGGGDDDTIVGGKGDDLLSGDLGNDRYLFNLGDGVDTLYDIASETESNLIMFGAGIARGDLRLENRDGALALHYSASDAIVFPQFDWSDPVPGMAGARIELADGSVLMLGELATGEVVALADEGGTVAAGATLSLNAQSLLANDTTSGVGKVIVGVSGRSQAGAEVTYADGNLLYRTGDVFQNLGQGDTRTDTFTYTVADAPNASVIGSATVTVTVTGINEAPIVAHSVDDLAILQGRLFSFTIPGAIFSDADEGDILSYGVTLGDGGALPAWLKFDPAKGTLSGRPGSSDIGILDIKIVATDRFGAAASSTIGLTVVDVNDAPVFAHPITPQFGVESDLFSYTMKPDAFADADTGDVLSYSAALASGAALPAWLKFDPLTRTFSGTPDFDVIGSLEVRITAADQRGYEGTGSFALTVQASPDRILVGTSADNVLAGASGNDTLDGGAGMDTMSGKRGNDTYIVDRTYDAVIEEVDEGIDTVRSSASFTLGADVEHMVLTGTGAISGYGNALANSLTGNSANNTLDGGAGADTMAGGLGDDTYVVDNDGDAVIEAANAGTDLVQSSTSFTLGANLENLTLTGSAAIDGIGNELNNILTGNSAANLLAGGAGNDTYVVDHLGDIVLESAGDGVDLVQSSISFTLGANVENLTLTGSQAINGIGNELDNTLMGNAGSNILYGGAGNDTLNGGTGADQMTGGTGDDVYVVDNAADLVTEQFGEGNDLVKSSVSYVLAADLEDLTLTGSGAIAGTGNAGSNILLGNSGANTLSGEAGDDTLDGGAGADKLFGGDGDDIYVVDDTRDTVTENADQGRDLVLSSVTFTLASNVEQLTLTGTAAITATGNALDNILTGNGSANTLNGGAGADILAGGAGNDTYVVDQIGDAVLENAAEGVDLVQSSLGYVLAANVENLTLTGSLAINGTGNELDNVLTGNSAVNVLYGAAGNDTLNGGAGADQMAGGTGDDVYVVDNAADTTDERADEGTDLVQSNLTWTLGAHVENLTLTGSGTINGTGNAVTNVLIGNSAANVLNGGAGADLLMGGAGNDTYVVDDAGDVAREDAGMGTDLVQSSVSFTLGANLENLTLTGIAAINGSGNELNNVLTGNSAANILAGGAGNDTYVVDHLGDVVLENAVEGVDLVQSSVSFSLGANVDNLTLTGSLALNGTGNELDNVLAGNSGVNLLYGGAGNDTLNGGSGADQMTGGTGNDFYTVDNAADVVNERADEGADLVQSSVTHILAANVEYLTLTGSAAINGTGNAGNNLIKGNAANNSLNGGDGTDVLQGGAGVDVLTDMNGNNLLDGGAGNDTLIAGNGNDFLVGGVGSDTITTGAGNDVIAFNRGDGQDVVLASTGSDNTVTLGRGITFADLLFNKSGADLVLTTGAGEQITFKDWYASADNTSIANLQIVIEGTADYLPTSGNELNDNKIEQFDFDGLVAAFDQARTLDPALASWKLSASLLEFHLAGSDTAAIGGDMAYQYARSGNLANVSLGQAQSILASTSFADTRQALIGMANPVDLSPRLM